MHGYWSGPQGSYFGAGVDTAMARTRFDGLFIASNRLPFTLTIDDEQGAVRAEHRRAGRGPRGRQSARPGSVGPASSFPTSSRRRSAELGRGGLRARLPQRGRGGRLLRPDLQRHALAALPLLRRPAPVHERGLGELRRDQRALRRRDRRASPRPGARSGCTTSTSRSSRAHCAPATRPRDRVLPPHPVPVVGDLPRCCRRASELLRGMLGADYIGFHTGDYTRHFRSSCLRVLGIEPGPDTIEYDGRHDRDRRTSDRDRRRRASARRWPTPRCRRSRAELDGRYEGKQLVLGVERLDYTKGIPQKLDAFERILEQDPDRAETVTMLQVLVPSRLQSAEYREKRNEIEMPDRAHQRALRQPGPHTDRVRPSRRLATELAAALPPRGRDDGDPAAGRHEPRRAGVRALPGCEAELPGRWRGALLLSEFAGASHVLPGRCSSTRGTPRAWSSGCVEALALDGDGAAPAPRADGRPGRAARRRSWAEGFLQTTRPVRAPARKPGTDRSRRQRSNADREQVRPAPARERLLLDYDGTLREIDRATPTSPIPTDEIRGLLGTSPRFRTRAFTSSAAANAADARGVVRRPAGAPLCRARLPRTGRGGSGRRRRRRRLVDSPGRGVLARVTATSPGR